MLMARMIVPGAAAPGELPGELTDPYNLYFSITCGLWLEKKV